jgi:hypothetical protein
MKKFMHNKLLNPDSLAKEVNSAGRSISLGLSSKEPGVSDEPSAQFVSFPTLEGKIFSSRSI